MLHKTRIIYHRRQDFHFSKRKLFYQVNVSTYPFFEFLNSYKPRTWGNF